MVILDVDMLDSSVVVNIFLVMAPVIPGAYPGHTVQIRIEHVSCFKYWSCTPISVVFNVQSFLIVSHTFFLGNCCKHNTTFLTK